MEIEQRVEIILLVLELRANRAIVVALVDIIVIGERVADEVVAMLVKPRDARGPVLAERYVDGAFEVGGVVRGLGQVDIAAELRRRPDRIELDHASRRIAAKQG